MALACDDVALNWEADVYQNKKKKLEVIYEKTEKDTIIIEQSA